MHSNTCTNFRSGTLENVSLTKREYKPEISLSVEREEGIVKVDNSYKEDVYRG